MTGKGLLKRILVTLAAACGFVLLLGAMNAYATPIRPDIRKIVAQPQQDTAQATPARAGWDGPEMPSAPITMSAAAGVARAERAELISAATPDPRVVLGIAALIFLLRLLKNQDEKRARATGASAAGPTVTVELPAPNAEDDDRLAA